MAWAAIVGGRGVAGWGGAACGLNGCGLCFGSKGSLAHPRPPHPPSHARTMATALTSSRVTVRGTVAQRPQVGEGDAGCGVGVDGRMGLAGGAVRGLAGTQRTRQACAAPWTPAAGRWLPGRRRQWGGRGPTQPPSRSPARAAAPARLCPLAVGGGWRGGLACLPMRWEPAAGAGWHAHAPPDPHARHWRGGRPRPAHLPPGRTVPAQGQKGHPRPTIGTMGTLASLTHCNRSLTGPPPAPDPCRCAAPWPLALPARCGCPARRRPSTWMAGEQKGEAGRWWLAGWWRWGTGAVTPAHPLRPHARRRGQGWSAGSAPLPNASTRPIHPFRTPSLPPRTPLCQPARRLWL